MGSDGYLRVSGWGPFPLPGERRRVHMAIERAQGLVDRLSETAVRSQTQSPHEESPESHVTSESIEQPELISEFTRQWNRAVWQAATAHVVCAICGSTSHTTGYHDSPDSVEGYSEGSAPAVPEQTRPPLSPREQEILVLIAEGRSDQTIAEALHLSVRTVQTHVSRIMRKLSLPSGTPVARGVAEGPGQRRGGPAE